MPSHLDDSHDGRPENYECAEFPHFTGLGRILRIRPAVRAAEGTVFYAWPLPLRDEALKPRFASYPCNVVILGSPGTGKSRFALELAARLRISEMEDGQLREAHPATVLYYSLEQPPSSLIARALKFRPRTAACQVGPTRDDGDGEFFLRARGAGAGAAVRTAVEDSTASGDNIVWFPALSPRRLEQAEDPLDDRSTFWQRHTEMRTLIGKFVGIAAREELPPLRMVVVDSLNVFGDKPISRYMIEHLFHLFSDNGLIGVCIAEDPEAAARSGAPEPFVSPGVTNLADVVLKLDWKPAQGYSHRTVEVLKSRHTPNAYGPQAMKLRDRGTEIYPSLHWWYGHILDATAAEPGSNERNRFFWPDLSQKGNALDHVLAGCVSQPTSGRGLPSVVHTVLGSRNTRRTRLALSYAHSAGRSEADPPSFLLVCFDLSADPGEWLSTSNEFDVTLPGSKDDPWSRTLLGADGTGTAKGAPLASLKPTKGVFRTIGLSRTRIDGTVERRRGCQFWFAPGYLLAEEFVYLLDAALGDPRCAKVNRVIFRDLAQVPANYPLMARELAMDGTLLRVVVELCRSRGRDCMFVCGGGDRISREVGERLASISHLTYSATGRGDRVHGYELKIGGRLYGSDKPQLWLLKMEASVSGGRRVMTGEPKPEIEVMPT